MLAMQEAPASGAPPWVALTVTVTTACSEIGVAGEALAVSPNAPPLGAAAGGATGAGAWGFGAAWTGAAWATGAAGAALGWAAGGGGMGSAVGVPTGCWAGASSCGFASATGWDGGSAAAGCAGAGTGVG